MNLGEIRDWFVKDSGRYDLITAAGADNGADKYIKAGMQWLDRRAKFLKQQGKIYRTLAAGEYLVKLETCRVVSDVWVGTEDAGLSRLRRVDVRELRELYVKPFGNITQGEPLMYTQTSLREAEALTPVEGLTGFRTVDDEWHDYVALILLPPPDEEYHVEIHGEFFSLPLSDDADENFWTLHAPNVLVKAGLRELEAFYRNYSGVNDWTNSILQDLFEIEKDFVASEYGYIDKMEG
jgi:hypothetical protein